MAADLQRDVGGPHVLGDGVAVVVDVLRDDDGGFPGKLVPGRLAPGGTARASLRAAPGLGWGCAVGGLPLQRQRLAAGVARALVGVGARPLLGREVLAAQRRAAAPADTRGAGSSCSGTPTTLRAQEAARGAARSRRPASTSPLNLIISQIWLVKLAVKFGC